VRRLISGQPMKFNVTLDRDEDGVWIVECPSIAGCISQGQTKAEALEKIFKMRSLLAFKFERNVAYRLQSKPKTRA
jgi:hypothetical protein